MIRGFLLGEEADERGDDEENKYMVEWKGGKDRGRGGGEGGTDRAPLKEAMVEASSSSSSMLMATSRSTSLGCPVEYE